MPVQTTRVRANDLSTLPAILSEAEAAAFLGLDPKKLRRLNYDGKGPVTLKFGREHRIRRDDLAAWLESQLAKSARQAS